MRRNLSSGETKVSYSGISVCSLLGVAFVILKLCHVIDWSWWFVTMPFWLPFGIFVLFVVAAVIIAAFVSD